MQHIKYYLPGVSLILTAGLIIAVPEILVAMVSMFIMMIGIFLFYLGHIMRKSEIELKRTDGRYRTTRWYRYYLYK